MVLWLGDDEELMIALTNIGDRRLWECHLEKKSRRTPIHLIKG
jgi:hypothetical protein